MPNDALFQYYATPGLMTDPHEHAARLDHLPTDIPALCETIQGLLVHVFWAERMGLVISEERKQEVGLRSIARKLVRIQELDAAPLAQARPLDKRLVDNCRGYAMFLVGILRHQGVSARARCGFGKYFLPNHYEDHWVCEYWRADEARWVLVDPQLDSFQIKTLGIAFDPCDVPRDQFITGGAAWRLCRSGQADPDQFGIFDMHGLWFVRGNLVRDFAALNKVELLPWDGWGVINKTDVEMTAEENALLDHIAELAVSDNTAFDAVRALYEGDARLRVPPVIKSFTAAGPQDVDVIREA